MATQTRAAELAALDHAHLIHPLYHEQAQRNAIISDWKGWPRQVSPQSKKTGPFSLAIQWPGWQSSCTSVSGMP